MEWILIWVLKQFCKLLFSAFVLALLVMILRGNLRTLDDAKEFVKGWKENAAIVRDALSKWIDRWTRKTD